MVYDVIDSETDDFKYCRCTDYDENADEMIGHDECGQMFDLTITRIKNISLQSGLISCMSSCTLPRIVLIPYISNNTGGN